MALVDLPESMRRALADSYAFSIKAQNYHWNVTGPHFAEYHAFFGGIYEEVSDGIDVIAEALRTLDQFAPASFKRFKELSMIEDELAIPDGLVMISRLMNDNQRVLKSLTEAYETAEKQKKYGISNILQDRITAHEKHGWMLRSFVKA